MTDVSSKPETVEEEEIFSKNLTEQFDNILESIFPLLSVIPSNSGIFFKRFSVDKSVIISYLKLSLLSKISRPLGFILSIMPILYMIESYGGPTGNRTPIR